MVKCNSLIGGFIADQAFICGYDNHDGRNTRANIHSGYGKPVSKESYLSRADSTLFEEYLIRLRMVDEPLNLRHDFIYNDCKIDVKLIDKNFNMTKYYDDIQQKTVCKKDKYIKYIEENDLTHFVFIRYKNKPSRPLIIGDIVNYEILNVYEARDVLRQTLPSQYEGEGHYFKPLNYTQMH